MKVNLHRKHKGVYIIDLFYETFENKAKKIVKEEMYTIGKGIEPYIITVEVVIEFNRFSGSNSEKAYLIIRLRDINDNTVYEKIDMQFDVVNNSNDIIVPDIKNMKNCNEKIKKEILKALQIFDDAYIKSITPKRK